MSLTYDIIKMTLVREGYLPNYPYHMVSDAEMCDAFIRTETVGGVRVVSGYFGDMYPCPEDEDLKGAYTVLVDAILYHIQLLKTSKEESYDLPNWVQSYMLGSTIGPNSDKLDIHDLLVSLNLDNLYDDFTSQASKACLDISSQWVRKLPAEKYPNRPPTIFGEPHVLKHLRLQEVNIT